MSGHRRYLVEAMATNGQDMIRVKGASIPFGNMFDHPCDKHTQMLCGVFRQIGDVDCDKLVERREHVM